MGETFLEGMATQMLCGPPGADTYSFLGTRIPNVLSFCARFGSDKMAASASCSSNCFFLLMASRHLQGKRHGTPLPRHEGETH